MLYDIVLRPLKRVKFIKISNYQYYYEDNDLCSMTFAKEMLKTNISVAAGFLAMTILASSLMAKEAAPNTLTEQEKADGWQLLFDGKSADQWSSWKTKKPLELDKWTIEDGTLTLNRGGGDIYTTKTYENYELVLEWKTTGNSGILIRVDPSDRVIEGVGEVDRKARGMDRDAAGRVHLGVQRRPAISAVPRIVDPGNHVGPVLGGELDQLRDMVPRKIEIPGGVVPRPRYRLAGSCPRGEAVPFGDMTRVAAELRAGGIDPAPVRLHLEGVRVDEEGHVDFQTGIVVLDPGAAGLRLPLEDQEVLERDATLEIQVAVKVTPCRLTKVLCNDEKIREGHVAVAVQVAWQPVQGGEDRISLGLGHNAP